MKTATIIKEEKRHYDFRSAGALSSRHFYFFLLGITLLSVILRWIVCWELRGTNAVVHPLDVTDMATYRRIAAEISAGQWPAFFDYQPFYYAVFLPLVHLISPENAVWGMAMFAQSLLGGGAVWLAGISAARLFGRKAALCTALLLCISRFHIFYTPFAMLEVLQSFWMAFILYLAINALQKNRWGDWIALALVCSFSTLTRGNALLFVPGLLVFALWKNWQKKGRGLAIAAAFIVCFYLPQLPFSLRNYHATGEWRGPSVAQNKVLALGNTPEAPPGGLEYPRSYHQWVAEADNPDPSQRTGIIGNVIKWMTREPWGFPELKFRTLILFWDATEIPNNISFDFQAKESKVLHSPFLLSFSVIGTLGLAGLLMCLGSHKKKHWLFIYLITAYWLGTAAFYMLARFRIGCLPLMCVAGGYAVVSVVRLSFRTAKKMFVNRKKRQICWLMVLVAFYLVNFAFSQYQENLEPWIMRVGRPNGLCLAFPDAVVIYDNGPTVFGGCVMQEVTSTAIMKKSLVVPSLCIGKKAMFRVWMKYGGRPGSIELMMNGKSILSSAQLTEDGWMEFQIPELKARDSVNDINSSVEFTLIVPASSTWPAWFIIDCFRQYARTSINDELISGELKCELVIPRDMK